MIFSPLLQHQLTPSVVMPGKTGEVHSLALPAWLLSLILLFAKSQEAFDPGQGQAYLRAGMAGTD